MDWLGLLLTTLNCREEIMRVALLRSFETHDVPAFDEVIYFGDGVWDARATAALGWPFIGLGAGVRAEQLRKLGASYVFADFSDPEEILHVCECAKLPGSFVIIDKSNHVRCHT